MQPNGCRLGRGGLAGIVARIIWLYAKQFQAAGLTCRLPINGKILVAQMICFGIIDQVPIMIPIGMVDGRWRHCAGLRLSSARRDYLASEFNICAQRGIILFALSDSRLCGFGRDRLIELVGGPNQEGGVGGRGGRGALAHWRIGVRFGPGLWDWVRVRVRMDRK